MFSQISAHLATSEGGEYLDYNMTIIELNKKNHTVATCGNDLTRKQYLQVIDALYLKKYNEWQLPLKLLKIIANISWWKWFNLPAETIADFEYLSGFVITGQLNITKQLIPFHLGFYGPDEMLNNVVMKEFVFSEHHFSQWDGKVENVEALNNLVAVLYRPGKRGYNHPINPDGDCRIPFNENICGHNVKKIKRWPLVTKLAIATWYAHCREQIVKENEDVFGEDGEAAKYGMISIIRSIAKEGTHGNFESVENKPLPLMMIELNETVAEVKRMEQLNRSYD